MAAKSTLAARVDASHQSPDGKIGKMFREEIEKKLDKLQEPPPVKSVKALPKPVDPPKKRRGGKRVRKMKERYAVTEMRKQANRITFGDVSDSQNLSLLIYNEQLPLTFQFITILDWRRCLSRRSRIQSWTNG